VYTEKQIKLFCDKCNQNFYSQIRKDNIVNNNEEENDNDDDEILYPVEFDEKHGCKNSDEILNQDEKVKCLECGSELYLNLAEKDDNFLICTKCKLMFDRRNIKFKCNYCGEKFSSKVKLYNNFSEKKNNVIFLLHSLRKEKLAFPENIQNKKCICDFEKIKEFKHIEDNGNLLEGNLFGNKKILCDLCFQIWDKKNFVWVCPLCGDEFNESLKKSFDKNKINYNDNIIINKEKEKEKEKKEMYEEEKEEKIDVDIYDENFEDYEESTQEIKDTKKSKEKNNSNKPLEIYEYKKEEDIIHMKNNNKNSKDNKEIKLKQSMSKNYDIIENNKTIKIDLPPPQTNVKVEKNYKITDSNRIRDKKFYITNQYHTSNKRSNEISNNSNNNNSSKIIMNRRNKNNIVESKYSSNSSNHNIINNFNKINNNSFKYNNNNANICDKCFQKYFSNRNFYNMENNGSSGNTGFANNNNMRICETCKKLGAAENGIKRVNYFPFA
jgi:hypothetical protein